MDKTGFPPAQEPLLVAKAVNCRSELAWCRGTTGSDLRAALLVRRNRGEFI